MLTDTCPARRVQDVLNEVPRWAALYAREDSTEPFDHVLHHPRIHQPAEAKRIPRRPLTGRVHLCWCVTAERPETAPWAQLLTAAVAIAGAHDLLDELATTSRRRLTHGTGPSKIATVWETLLYLTAAPGLGEPFGQNSAGQLTAAKDALTWLNGAIEPDELTEYTNALEKVTRAYDELEEAFTSLRHRWTPSRMWPWWRTIGRREQWVVVSTGARMRTRMSLSQSHLTHHREDAALAAADRIDLAGGQPWSYETKLAFIVPGYVVRAPRPDGRKPREWFASAPLPPGADRDAVSVALHAADACGDWDRLTELLRTATTAAS